MRRTVAAIAALAASTCLLAGVPPRILNTYELPVSDGTAELEWISESSFRFLRTWEARERVRKAINISRVDASVSEEGSQYRFDTRYVTVRVSLDASHLEVRATRGQRSTEFRVKQNGTHSVVEQALAAGQHLYGLGVLPASSFDLRGTTVATRLPFLISSYGFGQYHRAYGDYSFDLGASDPQVLRVLTPRRGVEFFVYYGPTPKEIFEEHMSVTGAPDLFTSSDFAPREEAGAAAGTWQTLADSVRLLLSGSLSARLIPEFMLAPYSHAGSALFGRAAQLASLMPVLYLPPKDAITPEHAAALERLARARSRLEPYLLSYTKEVFDRGIPVMHPMPVDFGDDEAALEHTRQFMLGDELLVAPVLSPDENLKIYLPRGVWTDLNSDQVYKGRQEIAVRPAADILPMFAKNGTIVPLRHPHADGVLELHYFPSLGAEFFLFEEGDADISQFHAAPAGEVIRLESESRADRTYEWVLHHATECRTVESGGKEFRRVSDAARLAPGEWHFDAERKQLRIRLRATEGGDEIVNITR